jgi:type IX secretion system PorP/SprF family membrane protein
MKKFIPIVFLFGLSLVLTPGFAQQDPLYGLYLNNPLVINPAYAGINNNLTAFASYRNQWAGFEGSPSTINAGAHMSLLLNKLGVGVMMVSDKIGENTNTQVTGSFAYKLPLGDGKTLSFGMQAGFINYKVDPSQLTLQDPNDPVFAPISQLKPNIGAGIILKSDKYMFGISVPRLVNSSFDIGGQKINVYQEHFYFLGSYLFFINEHVLFKPGLLVKGVSGSPLSTDVNLNFIINRNYSAGVYTRNLNSYGFLASVNFLDKFKLSYAFEVPTNSSVGTRYVTNEIMISVRTAVLTFHENSVSNF